MPRWDEHVLPHGPLEALAPRLWRVRGSLRSLPLPRNMVIWRADEGLVLHSVVAVDEPTVAAIEALGTPRVMIVPSPGHRSDAPVFAERWPGIVVTCPAAARRAVERVVRVDGTSEERLPAFGITVHAPDGLRPVELVHEVDAGDGTRALVFNDQVFHLDHLTGFHGFMMRYVTRSTGFFGLTGLGRLLLLRNAGAFAGWLRAQAERGDVGAITMSHGEPVLGVDACRARLSEAAARLAPRRATAR